jgi:peptidoglycan hydrolase CwlO-like protein
MKKWIFLFTVFFGFLFPSSARIAEIDKEISELEKMRAGLQGKISKYENKAQRIQFQNRLQEAKRYWQAAEEAKKVVKEIDIQIEARKREKRELLGK